MKRLFVLLAALAALSTVIAASALAGGGNAVPSCNAANNYTVNGSSSNLDIPAGTFCYLVGEFQGNVTVEGYAAPAGATFDKNVIVNGGTISTVNHGADIKGNLNISGSHGDPVAGLANILKAEYNDVTIEGNLNYTGNFESGGVGFLERDQAAGELEEREVVLGVSSTSGSGERGCG